ncbi:hypothetical protein [Lysobacter humi (ex Lee et al. 2017)]
MHHGRIRAAATALAIGLVGCGPAPSGAPELASRVASQAGAAPGVDAGAVSPAPLRTEAPTADVVRALAALPADRAGLRDPSVDRFLRAYFSGTCHGDERLGFDEVCEHADPMPGADPSPWPDLMIGLRDGGIASAVLLRAGSTPPAWSCMAVPGLDAAKACFPPSTSAEDRARWMQQWTAFFSSVD